MNETKNITARVELDSVNPNGDRLTTFIVTGPRWILAEVNTHRMLSRNAASSRAIPVERMVANIRESPSVPAYWGSNQPGMQSGAELEGVHLTEAQRIWQSAAERAVETSEALARAGLHKQWSNRHLEPFMTWTGLVSATDWPHFFNLRAHPDAQPEFQVLAYRMLDAYLKSRPRETEWGQWHIPFGERMDDSWDMETRMKVAVARAARLSYNTFEGDFSLEKDLELYRRIMETEPLHASPAEHVAQAVPNYWMHSDGASDALDPFYVNTEKESGFANSWPLPYDRHLVHQGNFRGWTQWRKMQPREHVESIDLEARLAMKPDWFEI